jgi:hypothetical protein
MIRYYLSSLEVSVSPPVILSALLFLTWFFPVVSSFSVADQRNCNANSDVTPLCNYMLCMRESIEMRYETFKIFLHWFRGCYTSLWFFFYQGIDQVENQVKVVYLKQQRVWFQTHYNKTVMLVNFINYLETKDYLPHA